MIATLPSLLASGLYLLVGVVGLWLSFVAWKRLGVTTFLWMMAVRIVAALHSMVFSFQFPADQVKLAMKRIDSHVNHSPGEMVVSIATGSSLPIMLSSLCLIGIAAGEFAEVGQRMDPTFKGHPILGWLRKKRLWLGLLAMVLTLMPEVALGVWLWCGAGN